MPKRTMPIKTKRITLEGDFEGWWADIRTNPPVGILLDAIVAFQKAQAERSNEDDFSGILPPIYDMLTLTIAKWNFVDEKGKDLPANLDGVKRLPLDLIMLLALKVQEATVGLPLANSEKSSSQS